MRTSCRQSRSGRVTRRRATGPVSSASRRTSSSPPQSRSTSSSPPTPARRSGAWRRSSWTRSMPWFRPSVAPTWRSPWSGWSTSPGGGCSASGCRRPSGRWTRWRASWAGPRCRAWPLPRRAPTSLRPRPLDSLRPRVRVPGPVRRRRSCVPSSPPRNSRRCGARSPSWTPAAVARSSCASRFRWRTWPASASPSRSPRGTRHRARSGAPSGRPSTPGWWSWSARTARPSSS